MTPYTPTDAELDELLVLEALIKPALMRIEEIKKLCKARGSFCSTYHVCSVKEQTRTGLVGLQKVVDAIGKEILERHNLINKSSFLLVRVTKVKYHELMHL